MRRTIIFLTILAIAILSIYKFVAYTENQVISIDKKYFSKDTGKKIILINQDLQTINVTYPKEKTALSINDITYTFKSHCISLEIGQKYKVTDNTNDSISLNYPSLKSLPIASFSMSQKFMPTSPSVKVMAKRQKTL